MAKIRHYGLALIATAMLLWLYHTLPASPEPKTRTCQHDSSNACISGPAVHSLAPREPTRKLPPAAQADPLVTILIINSTREMADWNSALAISMICAPGSIDSVQLRRVQQQVPSLSAAAVRAVPPSTPGRRPTAQDCTTATNNVPVPNWANSVLLFVQGDYQLSSVATQWVVRALHESEQDRVAAVALASAKGAPVPFKQAEACFDASGKRTSTGACTAPDDATLVHSCKVSPGAWAVRGYVWKQALENKQAAGMSSLEQLCERSAWRVLHLNLGERMVLAHPRAAEQYTLLERWRAEMQHVSLHSVLDLSGAAKASTEQEYDQAHSGTAQMLHVAREMMRTQRTAFVGVMLSNGAFVEMTLAWMCQVAGLPGVLERTMLLCTDVACLDSVRAHPASRRLGAVLGVDMLARLRAVHLRLGMGPFRGTLGADLKYGTRLYHLFMLTRQLLLKDLVDGGIPFLLFETDAWWQHSAYDYLDRVLASGGKLQLEEHTGVQTKASHLNVTAAPFDMLLYVNNPGTLNRKVVGVGGGFFLCLPLPGTVRLFDKWASIVESSILSSTKYGGTQKDATEQSMLQNLVAERYQGFRPAFLPIKLFPNGQFYDKLQSAEQVKTKMAQERVIVVQFNFIIGSDAKVTRAKRFNHWGLLDNGQCMPLERLPF